MNEKDVKVKPKANIKTELKIAIKSKDTAVNAVKDAKSVIKDTQVRKAVNAKFGTENQEEQPQKADAQASESVENVAYTVSDTAYQKSKTFVQNRIKKHTNKVKTREQAENTPPSSPKQHTFGEYPQTNINKTSNNQPKTRESWVKSKDNIINSEENKTQTKSQTDVRREYVSNKLNKKKEIERAEFENQSLSKTPDMIDEKVNVAEEQKTHYQIKTKESYIEHLRQEKIEPKTFRINVPKQNTHTVTRSKTNTKHSAKTRESRMKTANSSVKSGSVYSKNTMKKKSAKATKKAVKTQKEVTKKAAKEAAKRAKELAKKTAQTAKAAAKATAKIVVKIAHAVVAATAKLVSAIVALGGWAVLIVVLIVVIIIAALAASPFGIFISEEVTEVGTIPLSQIIAECNVELTQEVENVELSVAHDDVDVVDNQANWNEILAVFAAKTAGTDDETAEDVVIFDATKAEKLKEVFRAANTVNYATSSYTDTEGNAKTKFIITITGKSKDELISMYSLTAKQKEAVETLLEHGDALTSSSHSLAITDANVKSVIDGLPESLPQKRKNVVKNAASLVGKVNYFWGGKSSAIGWDSAWGSMRKVTAAGNSSSG